MSKTKWNPETDNPQTFVNGWGIFDFDSQYEIQRLNDPQEVCEDHGIKCEREFESDQKAAVFVQQQAVEGNAICRKAIEFLIDHDSPSVALFGLKNTWGVNYVLDETHILDRRTMCTNTMSKTQWNPTVDNPQTFVNGWGLFLEDDESFTLHGLDDPQGVCDDHDIKCEREFKGSNRDREAARFVQSQANNGDAICRKAIEFLLDRNSPDVALFGLKKTWGTIPYALDETHILDLIAQALKAYPTPEVIDVSYDGDHKSAEVIITTNDAQEGRQEWVVKVVE